VVAAILAGIVIVCHPLSCLPKTNVKHKGNTMDWSLMLRDIPFVATSTWVALGVGLGLGLLLVVLAPRWPSTSGDNFATLWKVWRLRGLGVGLAFGAVFGSLFVFSIGADRSSPATGVILLPAVAGALSGQAIAGAIACAMRQESTKRRVGHSQAVSLRDYVSSPVMWAARILVAAATVALILQYVIKAQALPFDSPRLYPEVSAFVAAPALLVLILTEVGARILITRPSSAGSVETLRQQDLQRVRIARDGAGSALSLGVLAFIVSVPQLVAAINPQAGVLVVSSPLMSALIEYATVICVAISVLLSFRARVLPSRGHRPSRLGEAKR
jgi:hypothetical protein